MELREAMKSHTDKSKMRALKMKFKMNGLPTILEESQDEINMDNDDIDKLLKLNDKIKQLETERDEGLDTDPTNRHMYSVAEKIIEAELQERKREYIEKNKHEQILKVNQNAGFGLLMNKKEAKAKTYMFINDKKKKNKSNKNLTDQEKSNAKVPDHLQSWIFNP